MAPSRRLKPGAVPVAESRWPKADIGPEPVGEILSRLFAARGWGRRQERLRLEEAWSTAIGPKGSMHTQINKLRRGVLEVIVDNAVLLQELAHFQKQRLLEQLRARLPEVTFLDLRFRAGTLDARTNRKDAHA